MRMFEQSSIFSFEVNFLSNFKNWAQILSYHAENSWADSPWKVRMSSHILFFEDRYGSDFTMQYVLVRFLVDGVHID